MQPSFITNNSNKENQVFNINKNNSIYKPPNLKDEGNKLSKSKINNNNNGNMDKKSMKPLAKTNNIIVNNTLKQKYEEMIKHKNIVVGLNNYISNEHQKGPRDSIRLGEN